MNWSLILHGRKGVCKRNETERLFHGIYYAWLTFSKRRTSLTPRTEAVAYMQRMLRFAAYTRSRDTSRRQYDPIYACVRPRYKQITARQGKQPVWPGVHNSTYFSSIDIHLRRSRDVFVPSCVCLFVCSFESVSARMGSGPSQSVIWHVYCEYIIILYNLHGRPTIMSAK